MKGFSNQVTTKSNAIYFAYIIESIFLNITNLDSNGGALYSGVNNCTIRNCLFLGCKAKHGGAIGSDSCNLYLRFTCFWECSARETNENGGDAIYMMQSKIFADFSVFLKCAPDKILCGDSIVQLVNTQVYSTNVNFSSCSGRNGECGFGCLNENTQFLSFMNSVGNNEYDLFCLPGNNVRLYNFINNTLDQWVFNGNYGKHTFTNCSFFGNTQIGDRSPENSIFINCIGDIHRSGITQLIVISIFVQSKINIHGCKVMKQRSCNNDSKTFDIFMLSIAFVLIQFDQ